MVKVKREEFLSILTRCVSFVDKSGTMPILSNILIEADSSGCKVCASKISSGIQISSNAFSVDKQISFIVSVDKLIKICKVLKEDEIEFQFGERQLDIVSGKNKYHLVTLPSEDFPSFPAYDTKSVFSVQVGMLIDILKRIVVVIDKKDSARFASNCLIVDIKDTTINLAGTDGARLALYKMKASKKEECKILLSIDDVHGLLSVLEKYDENKILEFYIQDKKAFVKLSDAVIYLNLVQANVPPYDKVLDRELSKKCKINRHEFLESLKQAYVMLDDKEKIVCLKILGSEILIKSKSISDGYSEVFTPLFDSMQENLVIYFNIHFLIDLLKSLKQDEVEIELENEDLPVRVVEDNYIHMIMPCSSSDSDYGDGDEE